MKQIKLSVRGVCARNDGRWRDLRAMSDDAEGRRLEEAARLRRRQRSRGGDGGVAGEDGAGGRAGQELHVSMHYL